MDFLGAPIGFIMNLIYGFLSNYGFTIIVISVLFKLIMMPLTVKQQKSMAAMQEIQPLMNDIQTKYANDKEKQSQEMMKIYQEYNISPFASCLPTLLQFPILIGLYGAIAKPLSFMFGLAKDKITELAKIAGLTITNNMSPYRYEIDIANKISQSDFIDKVQSILPGFEGIDFNFFGLNLSVTPEFSVLSTAWVLPVIAAGLTLLSSYLMQTQNKTQSEAQSSQKVMLYMMPIMILFFGFQVPTGLSLYWSVNSVLQIIQFYTLDRVIKERLATEIAVKGASSVAKNQKRR